ncbi:MAG: hypothetical protein M0Z57_01815 [Deltaproteobacteria bacterium]|jgi:hypothetical protein|nr:hypothetical protein [Deltaproteobacteria bacterium]
MNYQVVEAPKKVADWRGKLVRFKREMRNGYIIIPAGTIATIGSPEIVTEFECEPCKCCGIRARISIIGNREIKLLDIEFVEPVSPAGEQTVQKIRTIKDLKTILNKFDETKEVRIAVGDSHSESIDSITESKGYYDEDEEESETEARESIVWIEPDYKK